jgi:hypothetical protein
VEQVKRGRMANETKRVSVMHFEGVKGTARRLIGIGLSKCALYTIRLFFMGGYAFEALQ